MRGFGERMVGWCGILLILALSLRSEGYIQQLSAGHVSILDLYYDEDEVLSVNCTREPNHDWDEGLRIIDNSLWFLPVQESHSGNYSCNFSGLNGTSDMHFTVTVDKHECPTDTKRVFVSKGTSQHLNCDSKILEKITDLSSASIVSWTWMKDCRPLNRNKNSKKIQFHSFSEEDAGVYTCITNFTLNGISYTEAQSKKVIFHKPGPVPQKPRVIKPQQETLAVQLGSKQVLHCKVFAGPGSCETDYTEDLFVYWLLNNSFPDNKFSDKKVCTTENNVKYHHSNLTFEVQKELFNIPFKCVASSPAGFDTGTIILIPSKERSLYVMLAVFTSFAVVAFCILVLYQFKVDLVLAYRSLSPCVKELNDGKLYDAYVSFLHCDDYTVSPASTFTLSVLPEVLEDRFGYKLFISDRDTDPGTAVPDAISEAVGKSRRLIIVLTPEAFTNTSENEVELLNKMPPEHLSLNNNITATDPNLSKSSRPNWGPYECWVGLHDALVKECLKVILVQVGGDVDDALLPESLRYVKQSQGILKWKQHYTTKPNRRFWKQMRYQLPPVQKARHGFIV